MVNWPSVVWETNKILPDYLHKDGAATKLLHLYSFYGYQYFDVIIQARTKNNPILAKINTIIGSSYKYILLRSKRFRIYGLYS